MLKQAGFGGLEGGRKAFHFHCKLLPTAFRPEIPRSPFLRRTREHPDISMEA